MSYLILNDYYQQIQIQNLSQIIGNDLTKLTSAAQKAQEQCISYLIQKYDTSSEFTDTNPWSFTKIYNCNDRVYLDAIAYDAIAGTYLLNTLTLFQGNVYICTSAISVPETFTPGHWQLLGQQYQMFYALYSQPNFNYLNYYKVGDQVYWKGNIYTSLISTIVLDHDTQLQYYNIQNLPLRNVFPDDPISGAIYWGIGVPYSVPANTLPTNTAFWIQSDNRSQQLVEILIDLTLYKIHGRITPRLVPELRQINYQIALDWLQKVAIGEITPNLPVLQPKQGGRIRYGGRVREINSY